MRCKYEELAMKKVGLAIVVIALSAGRGALAADLPVKAEPAFIPAFAWTGCYAGGHAGGGWARKNATDPAQLVQDAFLGFGSTVGVTTAQVDATGYLIGGQFGCDYQFYGNAVVGVEGAVSGGNIRADTSVPLPLGDPGDIVKFTARADFISSATVRLGYAWDRFLLYVKGGGAWAGDKYSAVGTFAGTGFDFEGVDLRTGWTVGAGAEWALWDAWSARLEYDYYNFGSKSVLMSDAINVLSGPVSVQQTVQTVKLGLSFHVWASGW
jgi:opacity protein-like surface antigen